MFLQSRISKFRELLSFVWFLIKEQRVVQERLYSIQCVLTGYAKLDSDVFLLGGVLCLLCGWAQVTESTLWFQVCVRCDK